jgi:DNA-binding XRE family transcriptional regulator
LGYLRSREHQVLTQLLIELRRKKFATQKDFAKAVGWGRNKVERIEAGSKIPNTLEERDWAITCGISPLTLRWRLEKRLRGEK